ncbi:MAG: hypothetical protein H0T46_12695 [Deltaproteobacteria bacterium]|nr:hypothetical protein [Deltaproteobacteria bacterium]
MRALLVIAMAAGCGRLGFEDRPPGEGGGGIDGSTHADSGGDAQQLRPTLCNSRIVATLPIPPSTDPVAIRAVALPAGYAVAVEIDAFQVPMVQLDAAGTLVAHHEPFRPGYSPLHGIAALADRPIVGLEVGGLQYAKLLDPGWEAYTTGPSGDPGYIDPPIAPFPGQSSAAVATLSGGVLEVGVMSADGQTVVPTDYQPSGMIGASLTSTPSGARVVAAGASGTCEAFFVSPAGITGPRHTFAPCYSPVVAALDDSTGLVVHRTASSGPYAVHEIPANAAAAGTTSSLPGATYARVAARGGAYWIGFGSGTSRTFRKLAGGIVTERTEALPTYPFDFTTRDVFWLEGPVVHAATPCEL